MTLEKETSIYQLGAIAAGIGNAVDIAESKNSIFHQAEEPPTSGRKVGDIWYDSDDGFAMYKFDGTGWTQEQFGTNAISAGSVTAARLDAQDVYTNFLRVYFLSAAQAEIESLSAITANLGSVNVGGLNNEDGSITIYNAQGQQIGYWDNTGLFAQVATINGDITTNQKLIFTSTQTTANGRISLEMGDFTVQYSAYQSSYGYIAAAGSIHYEDEILSLTSASTYNKGVYADKLFVDTLYMQGNIISDDNIYASEVQAPTIRANTLYVYTTPADRGILKNVYNDTTYNLIRNHNNGDISVSASSGTLYLGYENTVEIDLLNGKATLSSSGALQTSDTISVMNATEGRVVATNNGVNRIYLYANSSGNVGLYSFGANRTGYGILQRANNSNDITAYGAWTFNTGIKGNNNFVGVPVLTENAGASRVSYMASASGYVLYVNALWGGSSYATATATFTSSDIRLKKNIMDCAVTALPLINAIRMREFDWKDGRHQTIGFIADELEKLDGKLALGGGTNEDGTMNVKSVDAFYLLGYAIKAIQELSAEINRLKGAA